MRSTWLMAAIAAIICAGPLAAADAIPVKIAVDARATSGGASSAPMSLTT
jgi:hypothetical protein